VPTQASIELEPLENLTVRRKDSASVHVHVLVFHEPAGPEAEARPADAPYRILGGVIFEFFPAVNCGLITYLLVGKAARGKGMSRGPSSRAHPTPPPPPRAET
jgi:hypothetical protein